MQKKSKNFQFLKIFFFARNNLKCLKICFATPFVQSTTNFRPVSLKKEVGHFQEICDPRYAKKVKKLATFEKIFFRSKRPKTP